MGPIRANSSPSATLRRFWRGGQQPQPDPHTPFSWPDAARLAILLGARPQGEQGGDHAFALARGIMIDAIAGFYRRTCNAAAAGIPSPASDFYAAAASIYHDGRRGLQAAVSGEHARMVLLGKWRRRAACAENAIASPLLNWEERWLSPSGGATQDDGGGVRQTVLATHFDRIPLQMRQRARRIGVVRPDWAPVLPLPPNTEVVYVSTDETRVDSCHRTVRAGWGAVCVARPGPLVATGATVRPWTIDEREEIQQEGVWDTDEPGGVPAMTKGGPTVRARGGAQSLSGVSAALTGMLSAIRWLRGRLQGRPALIRVNNAIAAMLVAGIVDATSCVYAEHDSRSAPASLGEGPLTAAVVLAWRAERARRNGNMWLIVSPPAAGNPFAERAEALAYYGGRGVRIESQTWVVPVDTPVGVALTDTGGAAPARCEICAGRCRCKPMRPLPERCMVCMTELYDALPTDDPDSRAPPGRFGRDTDRCCHATCRTCDALLQGRGDPCPICRAPRAVHVALPDG